jgi:hypothetical protein
MLKRVLFLASNKKRLYMPNLQSINPKFRNHQAQKTKKGDTSLHRPFIFRNEITSSDSAYLPQAPKTYS